MAQASQVISQADQQKPASALPEVAMPGLGTAEVQQRIISGQTNALKEKNVTLNMADHPRQCFHPFQCDNLYRYDTGTYHRPLA